MGTRALISVRGKPMLATHWDGYPQSLGDELLQSDLTIRSLIAIAIDHGIDAADESLLTIVNGAALKTLAQQHKAPSETIFCRRLEHGGFDTGRFTLCSMRQYGDWAQWQYDIQDGRVLFRSLAGAYPDSLKKAGPWQELSPELIKASGDGQ